jgi:hypothetical protein
MKPETVGMSSERLARLDEVMKRRYVDSGYLPGALTSSIAQGISSIPACVAIWTSNATSRCARMQSSVSTR